MNKTFVLSFWDKCSPNRESSYYQCCDFLIKYTGLEIVDGDKY